MFMGLHHTVFRGVLKPFLRKSAPEGIERTMLTMFHYTVYGKGLDDLDNAFSSIEEAIYNAMKNDLVYNEFQEGVLYLPDKWLDVFFVTLNKSDKDYSPSTIYRDYAINEDKFHWQSQSITSVESTTGQRYINQQNNGNRVLIFVRDYKKDGQAAVPYTCIGLADYVSHYGSAPISIVWKMHEPMPGFVLKEAVTV